MVLLIYFCMAPGQEPNPTSRFFGVWKSQPSVEQRPSWALASKDSSQGSGPASCGRSTRRPALGPGLPLKTENSTSSIPPGRVALMIITKTMEWGAGAMLEVCEGFIFQSLAT